MRLDLNIDLIRWIDANKADLSRPAFIILKLKEIMQDTKPTGTIHTKGYNNETHFPDGANHAPKQV